MLDDLNSDRDRLNALVMDHSEFFGRFGELDESVYADGAIPKRYKAEVKQIDFSCTINAESILA